MPPVRPVSARAAPLQAKKARKTPSTRTRLRSKHGKEIVRNGMTNKNKSRICYECHQKDHMGKDCPNSNIPKSNLVHYDFHKLRNDKNGTCALREISSPHCTKKCLLSLQVERDALSAWLEDLEIMMDSIDRVKGKFI
jgi:hypothetical protein